MTSHEKIIAELMKKNTDLLYKGFILSIEKIKDQALVTEIISHLDKGNIEAAIIATGIETAAYRTFETAVAGSYEEGGEAIANTFPRLNTPTGKIVFRFDVRNPASERWLKDYSSKLITRIVVDQKTAIRTSLTRSMELGQNPRSAALDIVGRVGRATRRRTGGIIGLSGPQEGFVANAREQLLSGDSEQLKAYLKRKQRDKRFDSIIRKAIKAEKPIDVSTVNKAIGRYSDRLLRLRGETISRTEALQSLNRGQYEAYRQGMASGGIKNITREWDSAGDGRVRDAHQAMDGQKVGPNEAFTGPSGARLLHPGDTSLGAGAADVIDCRCRVKTKIDFLAGIS